jgi:hypothetical protein
MEIPNNIIETLYLKLDKNISIDEESFYTGIKSIFNFLENATNDIENDEKAEEIISDLIEQVNLELDLYFEGKNLLNHDE